MSNSLFGQNISCSPSLRFEDGSYLRRYLSCQCWRKTRPTLFGEQHFDYAVNQVASEHQKQASDAWGSLSCDCLELSLFLDLEDCWEESINPLFSYLHEYLACCFHDCCFHFHLHCRWWFTYFLGVSCCFPFEWV